ncbi:MAG: ATP-binding protein [Bacteroidota bacterium]
MTNTGPQLILITGLPGTGKTTFARALAGEMGLPHYNTDNTRNALGLRGKYDPATKELVYQRLLELTKEQLQHGDSVVVDATFYTPVLRQPFIDLANELEVPARWIELEASEEVIRTRVSFKRPDSEADFSVYLDLKEQYTAPSCPHLKMRSDELLLADMVKRAKSYLRPRPNLFMASSKLDFSFAVV